jgi:methyltransferase-like protein 6
MRLLEVGCGAGNFLVSLLQENMSIFVYACDFSARAIALAKQQPK